MTAEERVYEATVAVPTAAATSIVFRCVISMFMNALNRYLIGLMVSNNAIETKQFSIK